MLDKDCKVGTLVRLGANRSSNANELGVVTSIKRYGSGYNGATDHIFATIHTAGGEFAGSFASYITEVINESR